MGLMTREADASGQVERYRAEPSAAPIVDGQTSTALARHDSDPAATAGFIAQHPGQERPIRPVS